MNVEEPDYGPLGGLGAIAASSGCRPPGDAHRVTLPKGRPVTSWLFPVPGGYVMSAYGWRIRPSTRERQFHEGIDIGKSEGASIIAPADGKVTYINQNPSVTSGRYLTVTHDDGWQSLYLHLLTPAVTLGQRVQRGQQIALMGKTGVLPDGRPSVTGPHTHMIVKDPCGNVVDPLVAFKGALRAKGGGSVSGKYDYVLGVLGIGALLGRQKRNRSTR